MSWRHRGALSPAGSSCGRCGTSRRGRSGRSRSAIGTCQECSTQVCDRHARWHGEGWICTVCARAAGIDVKQK